MTRFARSPVTAVLGPTNTGKTHLAVERLCAHSSGLMGFPLRLLAREVYDRVVKLKGRDAVALVTGEERIVPPGARWVLATAESMPLDAEVENDALASVVRGPQGQREFAFVAIDEAQLGANPERGHIFTDRLLRARGREETMILGSESLTPLVRKLVPEAEIIGRPRFSTLRYAGAKKLSRLPPRSAIIAFSAEEVYAVAEMLRRFRGGAAVVMGALSPATRNAQVAMYQAGEVDYLVATDAIGMGLNMDVDHVAFAALAKYDGARRRRLTLPEMAQIAGRAGRHQRDGSFGTITGEDAAHFSDEEIAAIESHSFPSLTHLFWRNHQPGVSSLETLIADLEEAPRHEKLKRAPESLDLAVLKRLASDPAVTNTVSGPAMVRRFWSACSLPDFEQRGVEHHAAFVAQLWRHLGTGNGTIAKDFVARKIADLDNVQGDVNKLGGRIAAIRTWAYISQRRDWLDHPADMAERAKQVEERLSDALHKGLAQRFVDRRTAVLMRGLGQDAALLPVQLGEDDSIEVDGESIGRLDGFRLAVDPLARLADRKLLLAAAERHLPALVQGRVREMLADGPANLALGWTRSGRLGLRWKGHRVAVLMRGASLLEPRLEIDRALHVISAAEQDRVRVHLSTWLETALGQPLAPLQGLLLAAKRAECPAQMRALLVQLVDAGGALPRTSADAMLRALDPEARKSLARLGIRLGSLDVFCARAIRPEAQKRFAELRALWNGVGADGAHPDALAELRPVIAADDLPHGGSAVYRTLGSQGLRVDLAEKLIRAAHDSRGDARLFSIDDQLGVSMGLESGNCDRLYRAAGFRRSDAAVQASAGGDAQGKTALWRWHGLSGGRKPKRQNNVAPVQPRPGNAFAALAGLANSLG